MSESRENSTYNSPEDGSTEGGQEKREYPKIPIGLLTTPEAVQKLEQASGFVLDRGGSIRKKEDPFVVTLDGEIYGDTLKNIGKTIGKEIFGDRRKFADAQYYLIYIRDGMPPEKAREKALEEYEVRKKEKESQYPEIPLDLIINPEAVKELEAAFGKTLDGDVTAKSKRASSVNKSFDTVIFKGKTYDDTLGSIAKRVNKLLTGNAHNYTAGRDYLIYIRDGMPPEKAREKALEEYEVRKKEKERHKKLYPTIPLDILENQKTIKAIEKVFGGKLEDLYFSSGEDVRIILIKGSKYQSNLRSIGKRISKKLKKEGIFYSLAKQYLIYIRDGMPPEKAREKALEKNEFIADELEPNKPEVPKLSYDLLNMEAVKAIEETTGIVFAKGKSIKNRTEAFTITLQGTTYEDSVERIGRMISNELINADGIHALANDYLIYIRDGMPPEKAREKALEEYEVRKKENYEKRLPLEILLKMDSKALIKLQNAAGVELAHGLNIELHTTPFTLKLQNNEYSDTLMRITRRLSHALVGDATRYTPGRNYLIYVRDGMLPEEAREKILAEFELEKKEKEARAAFEGLMGEIAENQTVEGQKLRDLIRLFGGGYAADILIRYHEQFQGLPMEFVKSLLADYLGDILNTAAPLQRVTPEALPFLSEPNLREALRENIKRDCLSFVNTRRKEKTGQTDQQAIAQYFVEFEKNVTELNNENLNHVFRETQEYYASIYRTARPEQFVEELRQGREFPDINQRINRQEIADKKRMLIADGMGLGKSGSAIFTKETLGIKQALCIVPSNVIPTWQNYLSDSRERGGYFKEGQAPSVLVVEDLAALSNGVGEYDYILCSQEKLTEKYTVQLQKLDYGMLIADEIHKLKNIERGVRAKNLLTLGEKDAYVAMLSGTPIPNKVEDIAITLKMLYPDEYKDISNKKLVRSIIYGDVIDLRSKLIPRMQMKELAESIEMPPLNEKTVEFELSEVELEAYEALLDEDELNSLEKMHVLRQFLLNPALLEMTPSTECAKINRVAQSITEAFESKDKVLVFVNGYIEDVLRGKNTIIEQMNLPDDIEIRTIEGEISTPKRLAIQGEINNSDKRLLVFANGGVADVGIDLSGAQVCDFYNEPWTRYEKRQQLSRVYREGLAHPLDSTTFIVKGTIEEGIHRYTLIKERAIEKLLKGISLTELEKTLVEKGEGEVDPDLGVNPELADYYISSWRRLLSYFGTLKGAGEEQVKKKLEEIGELYAEAYADVGSRSYQSNTDRIEATLIDTFAKEKGQKPEELTILDIASGPEMLKRHALEQYQDSITSMDLNEHHFKNSGENRVIGSFSSLSFESNSTDYLNLSLALDQTQFTPSKNRYERLHVLAEINRVLKKGGRALINNIYSTDIKNEEKFREVAELVGFKVVEDYTGEVTEENRYSSVLYTLEKTGNLELKEDSREIDVEAIIDQMDKSQHDGLKFAKNKERGAKLKGPKRVIDGFELNGKRFNIAMNDHDKDVFRQEQEIMQEAEALRTLHGSIEEIPRSVVESHNFIRTRISKKSKKYMLFKKLESGEGYVIIH